MRPQDVPAGFSAVRTANVLGNSVQFVVKTNANGHTVRATADPRGVALKVDECNFTAMVEFLGIPKLTGGIYDASRWHVGFVQNLVSGGIIFRYGTGPRATLASIAPEIVPCKDAGSIATWYDPSPNSLKPFGVGPDEMGGETPLDARHPARTQGNMRYIEMGDAPGTGNLPLQVPCKLVDAGNRARLNAQYTIGWRDPLDDNIDPNQRPALSAITGNLSFKTWLALSSDANRARIKLTQLFIFIYWWEWTVDYTTTVNTLAGTAIATGQATLTGQGLCPPIDDAIVTGADANESVCVKYM